MKKIISGLKLKEQMVKAVDILCDNVKVTLGPKSSNVIIDNSSFSPFITSDGVTIASNIESEDAIVNTILQLTKEASIKTDEEVGDGTTTTLVLLQSIFKEGLKQIEKGKNPLIVKEKLTEKGRELVEEIIKLSHKPTSLQLLNIACTSANNLEMVRLVWEAYQKLKNKDAIFIKEWENNYHKLEFLKGYTINITLSSPYYLKDKSSLLLNNPNILLIDNLNDIETISSYINEISSKNKSLVIIASEYDEYIKDELVSLYLNEHINVILLKLEEYGINEQLIIDDLKAILGNNFYNQVDDIKITQEKCTITFASNLEITKRINIIKKEIKTNNKIDLPFYNQRLSMLKKGMAYIMVGSKTTTERREAKMRFDDALSAISSASKGVSLGCGLTYYKISESLDNNSWENILFKQALKKPFAQIMHNAALDKEKVIKNIKQKNYDVLYNVKTDSYEDSKNTNVLDSTLVLTTCLENAISIAGMLLTTNTLIINEYQNNMQKINDYNEL